MGALLEPRARVGGLSRDLWPLIVVLLALAATATTLANGWTLDANVDITKNRYVVETGRLGELLTSDYTAGGGLLSGFYRPVVGLLYWLTWRLGAGQPALFFFWNILLHAAVSVGAYRLARRLGAPAAAAGVGAALFAVHPVHADVTAGVVGLKDLLAAASVIGTLLLFLSARDRSSAEGRWGRTAAGLALFLAGLFSKENAVAVLPVLLLLDLFAWRHPSGEGPSRPRLLLAVQYGGLAALLLLKVALQKAVVGGTVEAVTIDPVDNPLVLLAPGLSQVHAFGLIPFALRLLLWPASLSPDYSYDSLPVPGTVLHPAILLGGALALALAVVSVAAWRRGNRFLFAALVLMVVTYLPVSNLVFTIGTVAAERFLYLPSLGFCLLGGWLLTLPRLRPALVLGLAILLVAAGLVRVNLRNLEWRDSLTLWSAAAEQQPRNIKATLNAVKQLVERDQVERALPLTERLVNMADPSPVTGPLLEREQSDILGAYGTVLSELGRRDEALPPLRRAVELAPASALLRVNLAELHVRRQEHGAALKEWNAAAAARPSGELSVRIENGRERALVALGRGSEASGEGPPKVGGGASSPGNLQAELERARRLVAEHPDDPLAYFRLSDLLYRNGTATEAIEVLGHLLERQPGNIQAMMNRGILLSQSGRLAEAEAEFRALMAFQPERAIHAYNLGLVLERVGRITEARELWQQALAGLAPDDPLRAQVERRLSATGP